VKFVVGLGNPGREYLDTRHNLGWWVVDELAAVLGAGEESERWLGLVVRAGEVTLLKPLTYMNDSGHAVARLVADTQAAPEDVLVVVDDLSLELGTLRIRTGGSSGTHHGLESVIECIGTDAFPRLRLGIGPCAEGQEWRDFVLSPFDEGELPVVEQLVARAVEAVRCWLAEGAAAAMSRFNGPVEAPGGE